MLDRPGFDFRDMAHNDGEWPEMRKSKTILISLINTNKLEIKYSEYLKPIL